jgi:hypothetical protein
MLIIEIYRPLHTRQMMHCASLLLVTLIQTSALALKVYKSENTRQNVRQLNSLEK